MELTYHWEGDVLIPDLELEDGRNYQIGKCGRMRQRYLFENHHAMYTHLVLTEKLWKHLEEVDMECNDMMDMLTVRMAERVVGMNTENTEINEGTINFDIVFYVRMKDGLSQIIVNVEAQKDEPQRYGILNRAVFYVSRLISSQKERDFVKSNYNDIKTVYSIWVCMNMPENSMCHIYLTKEDLLGKHNWKGNLNLVNIVMIGLTNALPQRHNEYVLHRLLCAMFSNELSQQQKMKIMEQEYHIPMEESFKEEVSIMCNLSQGIKEAGIAEGREAGIAEGKQREIEKVILNMHKKGYSLEQIMDATELEAAELETIIEKLK